MCIRDSNKYMVGVDLADMLIELYRINFKSRKWYTRIFYYLLDLSVVNAWLLYRRVHVSKGLLKKNIMPLVYFKTAIADGLMNCRTGGSPRGRPSKAGAGAMPERENREYPPA